MNMMLKKLIDEKKINYGEIKSKGKIIFHLNDGKTFYCTMKDLE